MYKYASVIVSISMLFSTQLQAATEFLRFEGTINPNKSGAGSQNSLILTTTVIRPRIV